MHVKAGVWTPGKQQNEVSTPLPSLAAVIQVTDPHTAAGMTVRGDAGSLAHANTFGVVEALMVPWQPHSWKCSPPSDAAQPPQRSPKYSCSAKSPVSTVHERKSLSPPAKCTSSESPLVSTVVPHQSDLLAANRSPACVCVCDLPRGCGQQQMQMSPIDTTSSSYVEDSESTAPAAPPRGGRWNLQPDTTTMCQQRITSSNTMKNCINCPEQRGKDVSRN